MNNVEDKIMSLKKGTVELEEYRKLKEELANKYNYVIKKRYSRIRRI